ncbi:hypothetical protein AVEN_208447-1 [Araneus ventricosus]|uniref:Uncharacterized protein n=1 Tax=Araneus ventricosus TaxID=182803 RepID=A0A4Y2EGT1_ARAVE|nr:hypothetical protein AVEN_208447-1 [Araneus ventricosus]
MYSKLLIVPGSLVVRSQLRGQWWILTIGGHMRKIVMRPRSLPTVLNSQSAEHCNGFRTDFEASSWSRGTRRAPLAPVRKNATVRSRRVPGSKPDSIQDPPCGTGAH